MPCPVIIYDNCSQRSPRLLLPGGKMWQLSLFVLCMISLKGGLRTTRILARNKPTDKVLHGGSREQAEENSVRYAATVEQTSLASSKGKPERWTRFTNRSICWLGACKFPSCIHRLLTSSMWIFCHDTWCNLWKLSCAYFYVNHFV